MDTHNVKPEKGLCVHDPVYEYYVESKKALYFTKIQTI